jgi:ketol-acid reductoisomerase
VIEYEAGDHPGATAQRDQRQQPLVAVPFGDHLRPAAAGAEPAVGRDSSTARTRPRTVRSGPVREIVAEIYDEVADGTELRSVILAEQRLAARPMSRIGGSPMWAAGDEVRARRAERALSADPFTAGVFIPTMTAQIDEFAERGHPWSEIVNESVIEAVDSLLPYLHTRDSRTWSTTAPARPASAPAAVARASRRGTSRSPSGGPTRPRIPS